MRGAATAYLEYGRQLHEDVSKAIPKCSIPSTAIPVPDSGFTATYSAAYTAADLGARACADVFTAVGNALIRVANHYEDQEAGNTKLFGGKPIAAPAFPAPRQMSTSPDGWETGRFVASEGTLIVALEAATVALMAAAVAARHARRFHDLVVAAELDLRGPRQRDALLLLRREQPNVRAALNWLSGPDGDLDQALEMAGSLGLFWHLGRHLEGREVLRRLLALGGSERARAHALQAVSIVERPRGCLVHPSPLCAETAQESLVMFDAEADQSRAALSRVLLAVEGVTGAESERSQALLAEAEQQFRRTNDDWGLGVIGFVRMETALKTGHLDTAIAVGRAAAAQFRQLDDYWGLSAILYHLGWGLRQFGRDEEGAHELEEAIDVAAGAGLFNTVQWALADLALAHLNLGRRDVASDLFDRADAASEHIGDGAGTILAHYGHGLLALQDGDLDTAQRRLMVARDGFSVLRTPVWEGWALVTLARCRELRDGPPTARELYDASLRLGRQAGEPGLTASALEGLARTWAVEQPDRAAALEVEAADVRERLGRPRPHYQDTWHALRR